MAGETRRRLSAAERREEILAVAISEFATTGYHGTSTEVIAERAGISQPYVFRLYGTKKELFLACVDRCFDLTIETFRAAVAEERPDHPTPRARWAARTSSCSATASWCSSSTRPTPRPTTRTRALARRL